MHRARRPTWYDSLVRRLHGTFELVMATAVCTSSNAGCGRTALSLVTFVALSLAGCAAPARAVPVRGPDGDPNWVSISCTGDPTDCEALAGQSCPSGYDTAPTSYATNPGPLHPSASYTKIGGGPMWAGHVLVKCHGLSAANMPVVEAGAPTPPEAAPPSCHRRNCTPPEVEDPSVSGPQRPE
jgi:hypothetical protein